MLVLSILLSLFLFVAVTMMLFVFFFVHLERLVGVEMMCRITKVRLL